MFHARFHARGATLLFALTACLGSGCGDEQRKIRAKFVGTWTVGTGGITAACGILTMPDAALAGQKLVFTAAGDKGVLLDYMGCKITFDIAGDTATAKPGQTCPITLPAPPPLPAGTMLPVNLAVDRAIFKVTGPTGTYDQSGMANPVPAIPGISGCTYAITATAAKTP